MFFVKQKTAYEMRISDWSSDVCSSDLHAPHEQCEVRVGQTGGVAGVDRHWPGFRPRPLCLQLDPGGVKPPARRLTGHAEGFRYADVAAEGDRKSTRLNSSH